MADNSSSLKQVLLATLPQRSELVTLMLKHSSYSHDKHNTLCYKCLSWLNPDSGTNTDRRFHKLCV